MERMIRDIVGVTYSKIQTLHKDIGKDTIGFYEDDWSKKLKRW